MFLRSLIFLDLNSSRRFIHNVRYGGTLIDEVVSVLFKIWHQCSSESYPSSELLDRRESAKFNEGKGGNPHERAAPGASVATARLAKALADQNQRHQMVVPAARIALMIIKGDVQFFSSSQPKITARMVKTAVETAALIEAVSVIIITASCCSPVGDSQHPE